MTESTIESVSKGDPSATAIDDKSRDESIIKRFLSGEESAYTELVLLYHQRIFAFTTAILRDRRDAEEITNDTFIRAHRGLRNFREESSFSTWLHQIAKNLALNRFSYWRRRRRDNNLSLDAPISEGSENTFANTIIDDTIISADDTAETEELVEAIRVSMRKLPWRKREILALRAERFMTYEEIATLLGISIGTVKSRIARARGELLSIVLQTMSGANRSIVEKALASEL